MYEILGLKHVFSTFQKTIWSHLNTWELEMDTPSFVNLALKANSCICNIKYYNA